MRSWLLTFCILFAGFAGASGSDTVFQKVTRYWVTTDLSELSENSTLSPYLKNIDRQVFVVKVSRGSWLQTVELLRSGKQVLIQFGNNRPINFYYEPRLKLVYGQNRYGDLVILDPCDDDQLNRYLP